MILVCVCVDHNKLENSEKDGNTRPPDLPRETYIQVRKQQLELDMEQDTGSKQEKGYIKAVYCHIMRNAGLEEAQAGIKIAGRNISNLRYANNTTLMEESEELKSLLKMKKEIEKLA